MLQAHAQYFGAACMLLACMLPVHMQDSGTALKLLVRTQGWAGMHAVLSAQHTSLVPGCCRMQTNINDGGREHGDSPIRRAHERLIRMLLNLPSRPAVIELVFFRAYENMHLQCVAHLLRKHCFDLPLHATHTTNASQQMLCVWKVLCASTLCSFRKGGDDELVALGLF